MLFNRETPDCNHRIACSMDKCNHRGQLMLCMLMLLILPFRVLADLTVECNVGSGLNSTECGVTALATSNDTTALGNSSGASGSFSTALGVAAGASADSSTAVGTSVNTTASRASAFGAFSQGRSMNITSLGYSAGFNGGTPATDSPGAISIGSFANISPASPGAIAIGGSDDTPGNTARGAQATGENAVAIGFEARANQPGSIALGANVVAGQGPHHDGGGSG